jgi:putative transposase
MVNPKEPELNIKEQCQLLGINRSSYYYQAKELKEEESILLRLLDEQYLKTPFYGSRKMTAYLGEQGYLVNRKRVMKLMDKLGLQTIYQKKRTSTRNVEHRIYPYLIRDIEINRTNQVWCTDITYLPIDKGYFYLVVIMDWYSRRVLSWRISNTMDVKFCCNALEEALEKYGKPEIFNSDQGSQFTSKDFTQILLDAQVEISMDGRGRCFDNIFIERLWRSLKYELIYIYEFEDGQHLNQELKNWINWYNYERFHQALDYKTPDFVYQQSLSTSPTI